MEDIFTRIRLRYNTFTKAKKKLADLILNDPRSVLYKSITELATVCNTSDATVSRFCKELEFVNYQAFKFAIAQSFTIEDASPDVNGNLITRQDSIPIMAKKILNKNIEALNETYDLIDGRQIDRVIDWLTEAERIIFFGVGSSYHTALEGCYKFMRITPKVSVNSDTHMQYVSASLMKQNDVGIIISSSGATKETVDMAHLAKNRGARIVCLTRFVTSPLTEYADATLICGTN
ncbi:MAG: MurR/RpiR family transcriptional regulator, partial [Clostridiales Family XIII bacterium]|nr:MurR/RpiR family transcriptional regulator [Clostridiales Family XIII bacterium]